MGADSSPYRASRNNILIGVIVCRVASMSGDRRGAPLLEKYGMVAFQRARASPSVYCTVQIAHLKREPVSSCVKGTPISRDLGTRRHLKPLLRQTHSVPLEASLLKRPLIPWERNHESQCPGVSFVLKPSVYPLTALKKIKKKRVARRSVSHYGATANQIAALTYSNVKQPITE